MTASNEQKVDEVQLLPQKRELRYTLTTRISISNLGQNMTKDNQNDGTYKNNDNDESIRDDESTNDSSENYEDYLCPSFKPLRDSNIA